MPSNADASSSMRRTLGLSQAVTIGIASMIGAGVFVVWAPAAQRAGGWLLLSLMLVAVVAACNAYTSAILAVRYPAAGGTYVYGTRCLGPFAGYLAGWCFVVGKIASCAAMALTIGVYLVPDHERIAAVLAVLVLSAANAFGAHRSASLSKVLVSVVLSVLAGLAISTLWAAVTGSPSLASAASSKAMEPTAYGVFQAAGLLFFACAGYARIATLAEEVKNPERTLTQAVGITFCVVVSVYVLVAMVVLATIGVDGAAASVAPVAAVADVLWGGDFGWVVQVAVLCAAGGALLNMLLGVSRMMLAMARDQHFPRALAFVGGPHQLPWLAEAAVTVVVLAVVLSLDVRGAIGFSSFGVLLYYAVTNLSAWTVRGSSWWRHGIPVIGLIGCLTLVATLPLPSVIGGVVVIAAGIGWYRITSMATMRQ
ncbi:MAG: APC family permease [Ornithinimicrobium sp.]